MDIFRTALQSITAHKKITYALVALFAIGGFGILWVSFDGGISPEKEKPGQSVGDRAAAIIRGGDIRACDQLDQVFDGVNYRTVCRNNIALNLAKEKGDVRYCNDIDNVLVSTADCERQVLYVVSIDRESIDACDAASIPEVRAQCRDAFFLALALKKKDASICNRAETQQAKMSCSDGYVFRNEFLGHSGTFDCSKFAGSEFGRDCLQYQKDLTSGLPMECSLFQTSEFSQHCSSGQR